MTADALVVADLDEHRYHASRALSASGAKRLLSPGCPALFKHDRDNGRTNKSAFDFGHAAHKAVLGVGSPLVVIHADDWRSKAAQAAREQAYSDGKVPLLAKDKAAVDAMAAALLDHKLAASLLDPASGAPEVSVFWHDERRGIDRRARFDFLRHSDAGLTTIVDYKSCASAEPHAFSRSMFAFGYDVQAVFYADAVKAMRPDDEVRFLFIAQEKTAPYLVTVHEFDDAALALGRARVDEACRVFRECSETGVWPSWSDGVELVGPPAWLAAEYGIDEMAVI